MVCLWYNVIQVVKKQFERNAGEKNMKKILDLITGEVTQAFVDCGYDAKYGKVTLSNRPDLCEYQCNGAMAAAKEYKKAAVYDRGRSGRRSFPGMPCFPWWNL